MITYDYARFRAKRIKIKPLDELKNVFLKELQENSHLFPDDKSKWDDKAYIETVRWYNDQRSQLKRYQSTIEKLAGKILDVSEHYIETGDCSVDINGEDVSSVLVEKQYISDYYDY